MSEQIADFLGIGALIILVLSLTLVPYLLTRFNKTKYISNKIFLNSQGKDLTNKLPKRFSIIFLVNIFFTAACISKNFNELNLSSIIGIALVLPISYFIYKNCPISILFNKNAWQEEVIGIKAGTYNANVHSSSTFSSNNIYYTGIEHRNLPGNMYYHRK
ncbi:MAG: hypothetical protein LN563_02080 [Rickettsia endosymbiont of Platyusa sonomae]|nr:hypothetical protein [Rickettsia endosymbiont of Platyusa sonomae]